MNNIKFFFAPDFNITLLTFAVFYTFSINSIDYEHDFILIDFFVQLF